MFLTVLWILGSFILGILCAGVLECLKRPEKRDSSEYWDSVWDNL